MDLENLIVGNAAGLAETYHKVEKLSFSAATRITVGPITLSPREGNEGQTYGFNQKLLASANSRGLPSLGAVYWSTVLPAMLERCSAAGKELRVSLAGLDVREWVPLVGWCYTVGVRHFELNFGCPNVWGEGTRKPIPSYDPDLATAIFNSLIPVAKNTGLSLGVKVSPVEDARTLSLLTDTIIASEIISEVVACNTIPDRELLLEDGSHALTFTTPGDTAVRHMGGLAGAPLKPTSLGVVEQLRLWLPRNIRVIGCGGIFTGSDAQDYLDRGAAGFECGTAYAEYGPKIFSDILGQLAQMRT